MEFNNYLGIDPSKLTDDELFKKVTDLTDFELGAECKSELIDRNLENGVIACLTVLNYKKNDRRYGDKFYQASMLSSLFNYAEDTAIIYLIENYNEIEIYVLAEAISNLIYVDDEKFDKIRNTLKQFIEQKGENYFQELQEFETTKNIISEFIDSFK